EKRAQSWNAAVTRHLRDVTGRLDTEHRDTGVPVVLEEIPVVAGDFDDQLVRVQSTFRDEAACHRLRMVQHRIGERREIQIVAKQLLWGDGLRELYERTLPAKRKIELIGGFRTAKLPCCQQRVGQGCAPQR